MVLEIFARNNKMKNIKTVNSDEELALIESLANDRNEIETNIENINNVRTTTVPTTTTTTTQAATTSKSKNCRGLIQKRAHTLDDFMEGKKKKNEFKSNPQSFLFFFIFPFVSIRTISFHIFSIPFFHILSYCYIHYFIDCMKRSFPSFILQFH